jgi:hypothetical protein
MNVQRFKQYYSVTYWHLLLKKKAASQQDLNAWIEYEPEYLLKFSIYVWRAEGKITDMFVEFKILHVKSWG